MKPFHALSLKNDASGFEVREIHHVPETFLKICLLISHSQMEMAKKQNERKMEDWSNNEEIFRDLTIRSNEIYLYLRRSNYFYMSL